MSKLIIIQQDNMHYEVRYGEKAYLVSDEEAKEIKKHIEKFKGKTSG